MLGRLREGNTFEWEPELLIPGECLNNWAKIGEGGASDVEAVRPLRNHLRHADDLKVLLEDLVVGFAVEDVEIEVAADRLELQKA